MKWDFELSIDTLTIRMREANRQHSLAVEARQRAVQWEEKIQGTILELSHAITVLKDMGK